MRMPVPPNDQGRMKIKLMTDGGHRRWSVLHLADNCGWLVGWSTELKSAHEMARQRVSYCRKQAGL